MGEAPERSADTAKLHIAPKEYAEPTQAWADNVVATQKGKRTLIVGHSDTVHLIVNRLTGKSVPAISEQEFDNLFIVVISDNDKSVVRVKYGKQN